MMLAKAKKKSNENKKEGQATVYGGLPRLLGIWLLIVVVYPTMLLVELR